MKRKFHCFYLVFRDIRIILFPFFFAFITKGFRIKVVYSFSTIAHEIEKFCQNKKIKICLSKKKFKMPQPGGVFNESHIYEKLIY